MEFIIGVNEVPVNVKVSAQAQQVAAVATCTAAVALGLDSTTVPSGIWGPQAVWDNAGTIGPASAYGFYDEYPGIGRHFLAWLEFGNSATTITYFGTGQGNVSSGSSPTTQGGITGWIEG